MSKRPTRVLIACAVWLCCIGLSAHAASQDFPLRLTVLRLEAADTGVQQAPIDCNMQTYSAYCNSSRSNSTANIMVVKDEQGNAFKMGCGTESQWLAAGCSVLPVGGTYSARIDDKKVTVEYRTAKGKQKTISYDLLPGGTVPTISVASVARSEAPVAATAAVTVGGTVKCKFTSTPAGADILVDGKFVGSTPSELPLATGDHSIAVRMPGYAPWQRDLTVASGSDLTINSNLQKQ